MANELLELRVKHLVFDDAASAIDNRCVLPLTHLAQLALTRLIAVKA